MTLPLPLGKEDPENFSQLSEYLEFFSLNLTNLAIKKNQTSYALYVRE